MSLIKFTKTGSLLSCRLETEGHRVRIISENPVVGIKSLIEDGFMELNEHSQIEMVDFSDEKYLYHEEEKDHVFVITNEDDDKWYPQSYVVPVAVPTPESPAPSLPEVKQQKIDEMESVMNAMITSGVTVSLSDGTTGTFGLDQTDQVYLTNLRMMADAASDKTSVSIPWHEADVSKQCKFYSPNDIITITDEARKHITYHVTFFRDLRIYINSLASISDVQNVTYDINSLPEAYWSEVLRTIINS